MSTIREKIENNLIVWLLGALLMGFLSGIGTYKAALEIMKLETISEDRLKILTEGVMQGSGQLPQQQELLPSYLDKAVLDELFMKVKDAFNDKDISKMHAMLGPIARAQFSEEKINLNMLPVFDALGEIESGFYVQHFFGGKIGIHKNFALNYFTKYEKAERGMMSIIILDDGSSYQIYSVMFNRM